MVHQRLEDSGRVPATILNAGCGTGRHARALVALGHRVELADTAPELLKRAQARCPGSPAYLVDLCGFERGLRFDAVVCRGVLNDLITDEERQNCIENLAASLLPGSQLILDLREREASARRADGSTHEKTVELAADEHLRFETNSSWDDGLIRVRETYQHNHQNKTTTQTYDFAMRPWTRDEIHARLSFAGLMDIAIDDGSVENASCCSFIVRSAALLVPRSAYDTQVG